MRGKVVCFATRRTKKLMVMCLGCFGVGVGVIALTTAERFAGFEGLVVGVGRGEMDREVAAVEGIEATPALVAPWGSFMVETILRAEEELLGVRTTDGAG